MKMEVIAMIVVVTVTLIATLAVAIHLGLMAMRVKTPVVMAMKSNLRTMLPRCKVILKRMKIMRIMGLLMRKVLKVIPVKKRNRIEN